MSIITPSKTTAKKAATTTDKPPRLKAIKKTSLIPTTHEKPTAKSLLGFTSTHPTALHKAMLAGLPFGSLTKYLASCGFEPNEVYHILAMPLRTLARRKASNLLSSDETQRLYRLATVVEAAVELFEGDRTSAIEWLRAPRAVLSDLTPLEMLRTEYGSTEVLHLIGRLEHGVFS